MQDFTKIKIYPTPKELTFGNSTPCRVASFIPVAENIGIDNNFFRLAEESLKILNTEAAGKGRDVKVFFKVQSNHIPEDKTTQGYEMKLDSKDQITITGNSPQGVFYGVQSLIQLCRQSRFSLPRFTIRDWPNFQYRLCANWLQNCEVGRWGYDRGQGVEQYIADGKKRIDWAAHYKINMIYFDTSFADFRTEMFDNYSKISSELNLYARRRGVKLMAGGITACGMRNRKSYPHGATFECMERPWQHEPGGDSACGSWCFSDNKAWEIKCAKIRNYVKANEPGALYVHGIDIARAKDAGAAWSSRCPRCRGLWPDDRVDSPEGMAGAYAHVNNLILECIFSVNNEKSGFKASRDCLVCLIAPMYGFYFEDDESWQDELNYCTTLSNQLNYVNNVQIGIREQGLRQNNNTLRVRELAEKLSAEGKGHGVFVDIFAGVPGGGGTAMFPEKGVVYTRPVVALPVLYSSFTGAAAVASMETQGDGEISMIFAADYSWNPDRQEFYESPGSFLEWKNIYEGSYRGFYYPREIYGPEGKITDICQAVYGADAGRDIAQAITLRMIDQSEIIPLYQLESLVSSRRWWHPAISETEQKGYLNRWRQTRQLTQTALEYFISGRNQKDFNAVYAQDIDWKIKSMELGLIFLDFLVLEADICLTNNIGGISECKEILTRARKYLKDNFPSPDRQFFQACNLCDSDEQYVPADATIYPDNGLLSNMRLWEEQISGFNKELSQIQTLSISNKQGL